MAQPTPLERIVGFKVAEETYDLLTLKDQIILDLLIMDWTQTEIANLLGVSQTNISIELKRIRVVLAERELSKGVTLRTILEDRIERSY